MVRGHELRRKPPADLWDTGIWDPAGTGIWDPVSHWDQGSWITLGSGILYLTVLFLQESCPNRAQLLLCADKEGVSDCRDFSSRIHKSPPGHHPPHHHPHHPHHPQAASLLPFSCARSLLCPSSLSVLHLSALNCICCLSHLKDANPPESGGLCLLPGRRVGYKWILSQLLCIPSDQSYENTSNAGIFIFIFLRFLECDQIRSIFRGMDPIQVPAINPVRAPAFAEDFPLPFSQSPGGECAVLLCKCSL